ncbi:MAG: hypothetical protein IKP68_04490 [Clostridia bacterium]|nr:hypothetical protein [Clostridia bacterium]
MSKFDDFKSRRAQEQLHYETVDLKNREFNRRRLKERRDHEKWDSFQRKRMRSREKRQYATGLLSRGIAIILCFVLFLVTFGLLDPLFFGSSQSLLVVSGGSFDGSDVMLDSYRFSDVSTSFDMIDKALRTIDNFCYPISQFFYTAFGLGYEVIFLFSEPFTGDVLDATRDYIIVRNWNKLPVVRHDNIHLSSIEGAYSFAVSIGSGGLFVVYDINDNLIGQYRYASFDSVSSFGTYQYITYSRAVYAARQWVLYGDFVSR